LRTRTALRWYLTQWRRAWRDILRMQQTLLIFQIWYCLAVSVVLSIAIDWLLGHLIRRSGSAAVTNYDLAGFFLSPRGAAFLAVTICALGAFYLAERSGLLLLAASRPRSIAPADALWRSLRRLPQLTHLAIWYAAIAALLLVPVVIMAMLVAKGLLGRHDINYYLYHQPREWWLAVSCGVVLACIYLLAILTIWFRLLFALQYVLLDNASPRDAIRRSWRTTSGRAAPMAVVIGG
jgi:glycerophosphoryl diester phosphodiesterase